MFIHIPNIYIEEIYTLYDKEEIQKILMQPVLTIPSHKRGYIEELLQKLEEEYTTPDTYSKILIKNYLLELIIFSMRIYKTRANNTLAHISEEDERIQKAAKYMLLHYQEELTLEQVATSINLSPTYFSKQFKHATGFGFKEYLTSIRIQKAVNLLEETQKPITEIAYLCGFNDSNYFGDVFKKLRGISPLKYRNKKR